MIYVETMMEYVYDEYCINYSMDDALVFFIYEIDFKREEIKGSLNYTHVVVNNFFISIIV